MSDPQAFLVFLPLQDDLSVPVTEVDLDGSSGVLFPFYDADTNMLYVVGKVSLAQEGGAAWSHWPRALGVQGRGRARQEWLGPLPLWGAPSPLPPSWLHPNTWGQGFGWTP